VGNSAAEEFNFLLFLGGAGFFGKVWEFEMEAPGTFLQFIR
jgi:hypothetical protein